MRTYHNNSTIICFFRNHLLSCKKWLVGNTAHNFYYSCRCAEHKYFSFCHCSVQSDTEYFNICIIHRIYNNLIKSLHIHQQIFNFFYIHIMDIFQRYADNILCFICTFCFLLYILRHSSSSVTKGFIFRKFCFICRNQFISIFNVMHIIYGESSTFFKERAQNFTVNCFSCILFIICFKNLCFQRIVTP